MPQALVASGFATAQELMPPSIISKRIYKLSAAGTARATGRALAANRILPSGGITDFGVWASTQPDTAMSRDMAHAVGTDTTAGRGWLAASAPTEYRRNGGPTLWNSAVYAGVGIKWANMPNGQKEAFHQVQMESAQPTANRLSWDATSWEGRRCYTAQGNVQYCTVASSTDTSISGNRSGKITYLGAPAGKWGYWVDPVTPTGMALCTPGEKLNGSVSVRMNRAAWWTAGLQFYDANYNLINSTWYYSMYTQHPGGNKWATSYVYSITVPANSAYVAVAPHISINSTPTATDAIAPVGEVAYCDMHRIWSTPYNLTNTPTTYTAPKKLTVDVVANRVNLINNPGFDSDAKGWGAFGSGSAPFPASYDGSQGRQKPGSFKFSVAANIGSASGVGSSLGIALLTAWSNANVGGFGWKTNSLYTLSAYVKLGPNCPPVTLSTGYTPIAGVTSTLDAVHYPELVDGDWLRLWATFRTSSSDDGLVSASLGVNTADVTAGGTGISFWVDDALCEQGDRLLEYFDGSSPGSDYLWSGTPGYSSSHYYPEFRANAYRLNDIVRAQVPHGTQFQIRYARPPQ